ncbi:hypothetical protein PIB30_111305, partial [Stylosanthes scabra]|nr:hypothetical protein [Stylosanthes scabra]
MGKLVGAPQPARDQQEGRLLQWRARLDRVSLDSVRFTRDAGTYTRLDESTSGGTYMEPVPRLPVDVTRYMSSTGREDDMWWPQRLSTWYEGWQRRRSPEVLVTVHFGEDPRGTQQYYEWFARVAKRGRFLLRATDLADPRWTLGPAGIPVAAVHPRDDLVMPDNAPAPRHRQPQVPRPRQAAPVRGKLSRRDQRRRLRMVE